MLNKTIALAMVVACAVELQVNGFHHQRPLGEPVVREPRFTSSQNWIAACSSYLSISDRKHEPSGYDRGCAEEGAIGHNI